MSSSSDDIGPLVTDLVRTLRELEAEFEPRTENGLPRPPSPREMVRFTSDVGIPATILVLRTNIEALKLLQRALRMADGRSPTTGSASGEVRERAQRLSATSLSKLDGALADLQDAVEGRPEDEDARDLLKDARELRSDLESRLEERSNGDGALDGTEPEEVDSVPVDVDAELESIKDEFGDDADDGPGEDGNDVTGNDNDGDDGGEDDA